MGHILKMKPVFKEMIWGGEKLREVYGYDIPSDHTGECWAISAHKNGDCIIEDGEFEGKSLSWVFQNHKELFGNIENDEFPLLVKIIDAKNDLSVQVHPNNEYAKIHENSLGKTECWYVLQADDNTKMVMGHHAKTKEEFVDAIKNDKYDELLNSFTINQGDFYYIPSGTLHAICSGSLIYEAQQSSDITYRVYDYHRKDANGNERELHVDKSIDVTTIPGEISQNNVFVNSRLDHGSKTRYVEGEYFKLDCYHLTEGENIIKNDAPFQLVSVIEGNGTIDNREVNKGDHFVICSDQKETIFNGHMTVMITTL
jgi:mannose-6-phosphate isomerase